jgi:predicted short-subunit dehydrogenase-like oxidoreductase (DUF2520 family)
VYGEHHHYGPNPDADTIGSAVMRVGIVGVGKVGQTLARLFYSQGVPIGAVYSRTTARASALAKRVEADLALSAANVVGACDLTLLTVPDDTIASVALEVAQANYIRGQMIVHTSGAHSVDVLEPLVASGAIVGSLHPVYPFADVDTAVFGLRGATFAVEAEDRRLAAALRALVMTVGGRLLRVPPGQKAAYHAALVLASNYTVTLYALAAQLLSKLEADPDAAAGALQTLMQATVENIAKNGTPDALTGPIARGDTGTVSAHLGALTGETAAVYRALGVATVAVAAQKGLPDDTAAILETILKRKQDDDAT